MYKYLVITIFFIFFSIGYFIGEKNTKNPYKLDYKKMVINLPIAYSKDIENPKFGLGEKYLAEDMIYGLNKIGYNVKLYSKEDTFSNLNNQEGIEFYMREEPELSLNNYHDFFDKDRISVLYETIPYTSKILRNADIIFTGSIKRNKKHKENGLNSYFLPQFTRIDEFYHAFKEEYKTKLLYVANRWGDVNTKYGTRKTIEYAIRNNIPIDVYGYGWDNHLIDDKKNWYKGKQIKNSELKYYYSSADIVLNDTREDMIEAGFISNRIFDASACGAFIISDYIKEIEEIYGDNIVMYKNEKEFVELINYYINNKEERIKKAKKAQEITLSRFSSQKVLKEMVSVIEEYIANNLEKTND